MAGAGLDGPAELGDLHGVDPECGRDSAHDASASASCSRRVSLIGAPAPRRSWRMARLAASKTDSQTTST